MCIGWPELQRTNTVQTSIHRKTYYLDGKILHSFCYSVVLHMLLYPSIENNNSQQPLQYDTFPKLFADCWRETKLVFPSYGCICFYLISCWEKYHHSHALGDMQLYLKCAIIIIIFESFSLFFKICNVTSSGISSRCDKGTTSLHKCIYATNPWKLNHISILTHFH